MHRYEGDVIVNRKEERWWQSVDWIKLA